MSVLLGRRTTRSAILLRRRSVWRVVLHRMLYKLISRRRTSLVATQKNLSVSGQVCDNRYRFGLAITFRDTRRKGTKVGGAGCSKDGRESRCLCDCNWSKAQAHHQPSISSGTMSSCRSTALPWVDQPVSVRSFGNLKPKIVIATGSLEHSSFITLSGRTSWCHDVISPPSQAIPCSVRS